MVMRVLPVYKYAYYVHVWCPWKVEEDMGSTGTRLTDGCEPLSGCWELNPGPLQEVQVFLTFGSCLQPHTITFQP